MKKKKRSGWVQTQMVIQINTLGVLQSDKKTPPKLNELL